MCSFSTCKADKHKCYNTEVSFFVWYKLHQTKIIFRQCVYIQNFTEPPYITHFRAYQYFLDYICQVRSNSTIKFTLVLFCAQPMDECRVKVNHGDNNILYTLWVHYEQTHFTCIISFILRTYQVLCKLYFHHNSVYYVKCDKNGYTIQKKYTFSRIVLEDLSYVFLLTFLYCAIQ